MKRRIGGENEEPAFHGYCTFGLSRMVWLQGKSSGAKREVENKWIAFMETGGG